MSTSFEAFKAWAKIYKLILDVTTRGQVFAQYNYAKFACRFDIDGATWVVVEDKSNPNGLASQEICDDDDLFTYEPSGLHYIIDKCGRTATDTLSRLKIWAPLNNAELTYDNAKSRFVITKDGSTIARVYDDGNNVTCFEKPNNRLYLRTSRLLHYKIEKDMIIPGRPWETKILMQERDDLNSTCIRCEGRAYKGFMQVDCPKCRRY